MKKNTLDYINEIYTGGYKNALTYVNSISPVTGEEPGEDTGEEPDSGPNYLCFTATGRSTLSLTNKGGNAPVLFYSMDKKNWVSWDYYQITLNDGESVYFYGENPNGICKKGSVYSYFIMTGSIAASGNIQTLLSQKGDREDVTEYCYYWIFNKCKSLTVAPELPATTLAKWCYSRMFWGCTSLTVAPELSTTTLAFGCYNQMFKDCTSLTVAPELPATTLAESCYGSMFNNCTSLSTAPELQATTLATNCYGNMFQCCSALTVAPELPATTLASNCYSYMFDGCSNLQSVTIYVTDWNTEYTTNWLDYAGTNTTNPTVYCPADSTIPSDNKSGIPTGWTRADL